MAKMRVGVMFGGISAEKEISLKSGQQVFKNLSEHKYQKIPIFMDSKATLWQIPLELLNLETTEQIENLLNSKATKIYYEQLKDLIDLVFPVFHGPYGEDGTIQGVLELLKIPYVGSNVQSSANAMDKITSKILYKVAGIPLARDLIICKNEKIIFDDIVTRLGLPLVVKPSAQGSSVGVMIVENKGQLQEAIDQAFSFGPKILLEEYLKGLEITGGVFGNEKPIALPIIEIVPKKQFFDFQAKYDPLFSEEICPARISPELTQKAQELAVKAHQVLSCRTFSRTDMIIRDNQIYVLETNTLPGLTSVSLVPKAAQTHGWSFSEFLDRAIQISL